MMKVVVVSLDTKHGVDIEVYANEPAALTGLSLYCEEWWNQDGPGEDVPMPDDPRERIDVYFASQDGSGYPESYEMVERRVIEESL